MKGFDPDMHYHTLCSDCWEQVGLYGDEAGLRFWKMASTWINGKWTDEELKELADSPVGQSMVKEIISAMDMEMRYRLIKQEAQKYLDQSNPL